MICDRCPIPFRQNYVDRMLDKIDDDVVAKMRRGKTIRVRMRALAAFILMGMPQADRTRAELSELAE